ncbi:MAG: YdcF family protein [Chloroflexi bacterium]|nr:YdcF family protein [Chloroflexota bacterium]
MNSDYSLTDVTRERIEAAILLYRQGAIQKLYVSADNRHNQEADAIARYAMSSGVSVEDIRIDRLGDTTNDTCRHFAQLKAEGVLLTQEFHLPRAMYLCESNGVAPIGLAVNRLGILAQRGDGWVDIYTIRLSRYVRESMLTWAFMVGMYDR